MKIKLIFLVSILYCFQCVTSLAFVVTEDNNNYYVNNVIIEDVSFDDELSTKQAGLLQAKQQAFNIAIQYMKEQNVSFDEVNIDSVISSYKIVDEYYNKNFYVLHIDFVFDKFALQSFVKNCKQKSEDNDIGDYIVKLQEKDNIIAEYIKLKDFLKKEKIKFVPREISATEVSVLVKQVSRKRTYNLLKKINLNGKFYIN